MGINGVAIFQGDNDASGQAMARHIDSAVQLVEPEHLGIVSGGTNGAGTREASRRSWTPATAERRS